VVRILDAIGNPVTEAGTSVTVAIASGSGSLLGTLSVQTDANGVARFTNLAIQGSDSHTLIFGAPGLATVVSSPIIVSGIPSASTSTISAPATLAAGADGTVRVTLRTAGGAPVAGKAVTLAATGDATISPASATSNASGEASFTVRSTVAGTLSITATAAGVTIGPATIEILAGSPVASRSTAEVPGGKRFRETVIIVETRDEFGNRVTTGGADVTADVIDGPNEDFAFLNVLDLGDGTYRISYVPVDDGRDIIDIRLNGERIAGSPFESRVRD
jgi:hypothetical protein